VSVVISYLSTIKTLIFLVLISLITGCIAEDKEDENPTNSVGEKVDDTSLGLNGFWNGGFEQTDTLRILIFNGDVYGLDTANAFFGTVESPSVEEVDFSLTAYPLSYIDEANFEFVADGAATSYTINGLLATTTTLVGDYATDGNDFGSLALTNDGSFSNNSSLTSLVGKWTTTALEINITSRGRFHGVNNGLDKDCSFEGQIDLINSGDSLLALTINRRECDDFNGDSTGFVAINSEGALELYSKMGSALLFMKFSAPATSGSTAPDTSTDEPVVEEPVVEAVTEV
jgi:hypothetical protein